MKTVILGPVSHSSLVSRFVLPPPGSVYLLSFTGWGGCSMFDVQSLLCQFLTARAKDFAVLPCIQGPGVFSLLAVVRHAGAVATSLPLLRSELGRLSLGINCRFFFIPVVSQRHAFKSLEVAGFI